MRSDELLIGKKFPHKVSIKNHFQDYCENTTIHGLKYIGEKGRSKIERIFWTLVVGFSVAGSTYLITKVWHKWQDSPVILSFSETLTPIWQIPFPTVTICSETKARQRIFNFTKAMYTLASNLTEDEQKMRDDVSLICDRHLNTYGPRFTDESTINNIKEVAPQLEEMMWPCKWKMEFVICSKLFTPVLTEEGICYSFNILNSTQIYRDVQNNSEGDKMEIKSDWNLEKGYDVSAPLEAVPYRGLRPGVQVGITVTLHTYENDIDYLCRGPVQGFKILLNYPVEIPKPSEHYFRVPLRQQLLLSVKPNMMTTSEGLRSYQPSSRKCYFPSERHLAYFKVYTQYNCELECLTNYTLEKCQCAAIYMPRLTESTPVCGAGSKQCTHEANDEMYMEEIMLNIQKVQTRNNTCDCLPACTSLQYDAEISQAYFKSHFEGLQLSRVSIYFKDVQFRTSIRNEKYSVVDFLAICGGVLGLFSGISILSLIEITLLCNFTPT